MFESLWIWILAAIILAGINAYLQKRKGYSFLPIFFFSFLLIAATFAIVYKAITGVGSR